MRRTKEDAELTRKAILDSAMDIFYEKGYSKTTFDEIAKRINLTKGAVYWYFRNKPDIVAALINEYATEHIKLIDEHYAKKENMDFDDIINAKLMTNKIIQENPKFYKFMFFILCQMEWSESIILKVQPLIKQLKDYPRKFLYDALNEMKKNKKIKADTNIETVTETLLFMHYGLLDGYLSKRIDGDFDALLKDSCNLIFNSIKTEGK